jgi:hypothetical protein
VATNESCSRQEQRAHKQVNTQPNKDTFLQPQKPKNQNERTNTQSTKTNNQKEN